MDSVADCKDERTVPLKDALSVDTEAVRAHVDEVVRGTVQETLNALLDAEADRACGAGRYERSADRQDTRSGSYRRRPGSGAWCIFTATS